MVAQSWVRANPGLNLGHCFSFGISTLALKLETTVEPGTVSEEIF